MTTERPVPTPLQKKAEEAALDVFAIFTVYTPDIVQAITGQKKALASVPPLHIAISSEVDEAGHIVEGLGNFSMI